MYFSNLNIVLNYQGFEEFHCPDNVHPVVFTQLCSHYHQSKLLDKPLGIRQSTTMPYNPCGNSQCEQVNRTLFSLMRTLDQEQKPNWPTYLPSLVFTYNAMPHSTTGYQPYELMFGHKAPMPCDNWLGLKNYQLDSFKSKTAWLNEQLNAMLYANKQALKGIHKTTKHNKDRTSGKDITIPVGNHVLLCDHPEGCNKIQDRYKSEIYVVVGHHQEPNVYYIQLLNSSKPSQPKVVNWHQLFDLKRSEPSSASPSGDDGFAPVPSFLHRQPTNCSSNFSNSNDQHNSHHYSTRSKCKAAATVNPVVVETIITHF